jgi:hypothetical protein
MVYSFTLFSFLQKDLGVIHIKNNNLWYRSLPNIKARTASAHNFLYLSLPCRSVPPIRPFLPVRSRSYRRRPLSKHASLLIHTKESFLTDQLHVLSPEKGARTLGTTVGEVVRGVKIRCIEFLGFEVMLVLDLRVASTSTNCTIEMLSCRVHTRNRHPLIWSRRVKPL